MATFKRNLVRRHCQLRCHIANSCSAWCAALRRTASTQAEIQPEGNAERAGVIGKVSQTRSRLPPRT